MRGVIYAEFGQFIGATFGASAREELLLEAGLPGKRYLSGQSYPDEELFALVLAATRKSGRSTADLLEDFGEHLAPMLARTYSVFIADEWKTLDLLEHTEHVIHKAVRTKTPGATPPQLGCSRLSLTKVHISYCSERKLCHLAKGLIRGISGLYGEWVEILEESCMLMGGQSCELTVQLVD